MFQKHSSKLVNKCDAICLKRTKKFYEISFENDVQKKIDALSKNEQNAICFHTFSEEEKKISTNFISDASSEQTEIWCELCTVDSLSSSDGFQCFPWEKLFGFMNIKHECVC